MRYRLEHRADEPARTAWDGPKRPEGPRRVLVTGGAGGIGSALVKEFARAGERVIFTFRPVEASRKRAEELAQSLRDHDVRAIPFDQGIAESHAQLLRLLPDPVDIVIHNAAVGTKTVESVASTPMAQDEAFLRVNALGPLWLTQALLPGMLQRRYGKIIFISSVEGGIFHFPRFRPADGMSKAALTFFGRQLAAELAHEPVDVFTVCPGATDTPMFRASTLSRLSDEDRRTFEARLPGKRLIAPGEIAELCVHLCGDGARVLRGAVLDASFGLGVRPDIMMME